jgi:mannose-1-phosphate guanylyltransferase
VAFDSTGSTWSIVLAGGDGTRLAPLTRDAYGRVVPKQFCSFGGTQTLLGATLARSARHAVPEQTLVVVAADHEYWWSRALAALPPTSVVVQPANRGTGPGLLLPLLEVFRRDPEATVVVFPSDHHVEDEGALEASLLQATVEARKADDSIVLLGMRPHAAEMGYGWIVVGEPTGDGGARPVAAFVEKPPEGRAAELYRDGALWSSFLLAARAHALFDLVSARHPRLVNDFLRATAPLPTHSGPTPIDGIRDLYDGLATVDLARDVLATAPGRLRVLAVPPCGWSDLGTPERLLAWMRRQRATATVGSPVLRSARRHAPEAPLPRRTTPAACRPADRVGESTGGRFLGGRPLGADEPSPSLVLRAVLRPDGATPRPARSSRAGAGPSVLADPLRRRLLHEL